MSLLTGQLRCNIIYLPLTRPPVLIPIVLVVDCKSLVLIIFNAASSITLEISKLEFKFIISRNVKECDEDEDVSEIFKAQHHVFIFFNFELFIAVITFYL